jgi:hypothetical protein
MMEPALLRILQCYLTMGGPLVQAFHDVAALIQLTCRTTLSARTTICVHSLL